MKWWWECFRLFTPGRPAPSLPAPELPRPIHIRDIRQGDRFVEEFAGRTGVFVALEDAYPTADRLGNLAGHEFRAEGADGQCTFFCATGFEHYASRLTLLPPADEVAAHHAEFMATRTGCPRSRSGRMHLDGTSGGRGIASGTPD